MVYDNKISVAKCFGVNPLGGFSVSVYVKVYICRYCGCCDTRTKCEP